MKKLIAIIFLTALVTGCSATRNLNGNLSDTDKLEESPCAGCMQIPYEDPSFEWSELNA
ncbi:MAG: membrane lipoprotein lipid attachment site-containing protein [Alphaproteobacteria bacterium]|nr:membrane lipoprotein lipid attachment site-containing protein [Alphaproteobacteria bacterium]